MNCLVAEQPAAARVSAGRLVVDRRTRRVVAIW